jgi:glycosyltransferase XagB
MKYSKRLRTHGGARNPSMCASNGRDPSAYMIARSARNAQTKLNQTFPSQSAKTPSGRVMAAGLVALSICAIFGSLGVESFRTVWQTLCFGFALLGLVRLLACFVPLKRQSGLSNTAGIDAAPIWTLLIALYKEADSVASLLEALAKLEWPKDQLDIIFACERDDAETLAALTQLRKIYQFRIVRVPKGGPRTKPNALETALPFARGRFVSVYDAEDRPSPSQLRAAFQAFVTGPSNLAVVQAPLVTWNHEESWIARQFALDYALWFRLMLPVFSRLSGLLPLGGTSNHFRTSILRQVGGWDPYNVTEDADLGVRLARNGYLAGLIEPPTFEEAPPKCSAWVRQRGRWIQGHIQTCSVHLRTPFGLAKRIGLKGCLAFILGLGIGPMAAVVSLPIFLGSVVGLASNTSPIVWHFLALSWLANALASLVACHRDGRWQLIKAIPTLPLYYCLQSLSACRAIWRVVFTPTIWDKTDHGRAARVSCAKGRYKWIGRQHS